jgi:hypothetical protein
MWKSFAILSSVALSACFISCVGPNYQNAPADAVVRSYAALSNQDSIAFLGSLARDKREVYEAIPEAMHSLLDEWKGRHAEVTVLSVQRKDSAATILYNLKVTGRDPMESDSLTMQADLENNGWEYGY